MHGGGFKFFVLEIVFRRLLAAGDAHDRALGRAGANEAGLVGRLVIFFVLAFAVVILVGQFFFRRLGIAQLPHERATGNLDDEILARQAIHALAHAVMAVLGEESGLVKLLDEVVEVVARFENHVAPATAVAPAGSALGPVGLAHERDGPFATVAGARINLDLVNEHLAGKLLVQKKKARPSDLALKTVSLAG